MCSVCRRVLPGAGPVASVDRCPDRLVCGRKLRLAAKLHAVRKLGTQGCTRAVVLVIARSRINSSAFEASSHSLSLAFGNSRPITGVTSKWPYFSKAPVSFNGSRCCEGGHVDDEFHWSGTVSVIVDIVYVAATCDCQEILS